MKRNGSHIGLATVGLAGVLLFAGASAGTSTDGKSVFAANQCGVCHSVQSVGITRTAASSKAPDLSGVGLRHNAVWMTKYLQKEEELNGAKHAKKFKGSDADLASLTAWLATQKKK
jgi:mono/diheme cytochrome c family protein